MTVTSSPKFQKYMKPSVALSGLHLWMQPKHITRYPWPQSVTKISPLLLPRMEVCIVTVSCLSAYEMQERNGLALLMVPSKD